MSIRLLLQQNRCFEVTASSGNTAKQLDVPPDIPLGCELRAEIDDDVRPGTVASTSGWRSWTRKTVSCCEHMQS